MGRATKPPSTTGKDMRAARVLFAAGLSLIVVAAMRAYSTGVITPAILRSGRIPVLPIVVFAGALALTVLIALMVRAMAITTEQALARERDARELLALQARRFHTLEREGWDGVMIVDSMGIIRWMGVTAAKLLRLDPRHVMGASVLGLVHMSDLDGFLAALAVPDDGSARTFEFRVTDAQDRERWFEGVVSNHEDDEAVSGVVLHFRDTTEWHTVENVLRDGRDHVRAAFDDSPFGTAIIDGDGVLGSANDALGEVMGRDAASLTGRPIGSLLSPRDRYAVRVALRRIKNFQVEDAFKREVVLSNGISALLALTPIVTDPDEIRSLLLQVVAYPGPAVEIQPDDDEKADDEQADEEESEPMPAAIAPAVRGWADAIVDLDIDEPATPVVQTTDEVLAESDEPFSVLRAIARAHQTDKVARSIDTDEPTLDDKDDEPTLDVEDDQPDFRALGS